MHSPLKATALAALLLALFTATVVRQPALAATVGVAAPQITTMALNSDAGLTPGATLRVQLSTAADADRATVTLGEHGPTVALRQQTAGNYTGTYIVRRSDRIDPTTRMVARVAFGERVASRQFNFPPSFQALALGGPPEAPTIERFRRDHRPPQISELAPENGERVTFRGRTHVRARLADAGSGVDPASVRLRLNGRDVTAESRVSPDEVHYRADLDPGPYTAELTVRDQAGNTAVQRWSFDVAPGDRLGAASPGGLPLQITSHADNMSIDAAGNVAIRGRTAPYATVRVQVDAVPRVAGASGVTQPVADQSVLADHEGRFAVALAPRAGLPIPGTRYDVRITASSGTQTADERLTLVQREG